MNNKIDENGLTITIPLHILECFGEQIKDNELDREQY